MKVITNKYIPFHGYVAMVLFDIILWRKEYEYRQRFISYYDRVINHESIHIQQMKDFCPIIYIGGIIFYIIYLFEWLFRVLFTKDFFSKKAYNNISFEKEAKQNETNLEYIRNRKRFAQWK